jgi:hypothetical protein
MRAADIKINQLMNIASNGSATNGPATSCSPNASFGLRECIMEVNSTRTTGTPVWTLALSEASSSSGSYTAVAGATDITAVSTDGVYRFKVRPKYEWLRAEVASVATSGSGTLTINLLSMNRVD